MGGEPLLHPQVNDFMRITREAYPHSKIFIVTNGLLLLKMPNDFWETLRQYRIRIHWSKYPPFKDKFSEIEQRIKEARIPWRRCKCFRHVFGVRFGREHGSE